MNAIPLSLRFDGTQTFGSRSVNLFTVIDPALACFGATYTARPEATAAQLLAQLAAKEAEFSQEVAA